MVVALKMGVNSKMADKMMVIIDLEKEAVDFPIRSQMKKQNEEVSSNEKAKNIKDITKSFTNHHNLYLPIMKLFFK